MLNVQRENAKVDESCSVSSIEAFLSERLTAGVDPSSSTTLGHTRDQMYVSVSFISNAEEILQVEIIRQNFTSNIDEW